MVRQLLFIFLLIHSALAQGPVNPNPAKPNPDVDEPEPGHPGPGALPAKPAPANPGPKKPWLTLKGEEPLVIARGGFSGLYPDSSNMAIVTALQASKPGTVMFCDLQLTKDNLGVCQSSLQLDLSTTVATAFPKGKQTYNVNGKDVTGWFTLDYTIEQLLKDVALLQNVFSRSALFDGQFGLLAPEQIVEEKPKPSLWINVQNDLFYSQHNLSALRYLEDSTSYFVPAYVSSPEIGFLKALGASKMDKMKTKLIFRFMNKEDMEPTTKEKYGSILTKLATIKTFASGILVPKDYIWPLSKDLYLEPATTLVADAHKEGLEVYASGFVNDDMTSYNYSYDPVAEYLQFIDNSKFSVDGVLTDFPPTASEAISCLAFNQNATKKIVKGLVISNNGASGDYPGNTDLAYEKAINDGADIIDCTVQMSKDGIAFCLESADLTGRTTAATMFMDRSVNIPEIQSKDGIFSFDLSWEEIQTLKPQISNIFMDQKLYRNPRAKNAGKLLTLPEFLELSKKKAPVGVLISIQNAAYLASKKGLDIIQTITSALSNATLDKQSDQRVLIESDDSSVLTKFKDIPTYQKVLSIKDPKSGVPAPVAKEVKKFADAVVIARKSVLASNADFLSTAFTNVVKEMHAANVSVYVADINNEFVSQVFDMFADPYVELATYLEAQKVDGVITSYPKTATAYIKSPCADVNNANLPFIFFSIQPGSLLSSVVEKAALAPAGAPLPALETSDVVDPPLPAVTNVPVDDKAITNTTTSTPATPPKSSGPPKATPAGSFFSVLALMLISLFFY